MENKEDKKEKVVCQSCGGTKWFQAPIVHARCADCRKVVRPIDPLTNEVLSDQEVPVSSVH